MTEDEKIARLFDFLTQSGFAFERDYSKGTDSTCTQIYRFKQNAANYLEFRVLSERERGLVVCVGGEKRFPSLEKRHGGAVRAWKIGRFFGKGDIWQLYADLCRREIEKTGSLFGLRVQAAP